MTTPRQNLDPELLLAQAGWLRALARSLLADPNRADDLVQDTWVAALEHPPREPAALRRWLGKVARNLAGLRARSDRRRIAREQLVVAAAGDSPSADDSASRLLSHRQLVQAVLELDEPYRTTVVLRYFDGLEPSEIARRQAIPPSTVRTRLSRARDQLRTKLQATHGADWRDSCLAILGPGLAVAEPAATSLSPWSLPVFAMKKAIILASAGLVLILATLLWVASGPSHGEEHLGLSGAAITAEAQRGAPEGPPEGPLHRTVISAAPGAGDPAGAAGSPLGPPVEGWVFFESRPVSGASVRLCLEGAKLEAATDAAGYFQLPASSLDPVPVAAESERGVYFGRVGSWPARIELQPRYEFHVLVQDALNGAPIPDASVRVLARREVAIDETWYDELDALAEGRTDADGSCRLPGLRLESVFVEARAAGWTTNAVHARKSWNALTAQAEFHVLLMPADHWLRIVDGAGIPIGNARVDYGTHEAGPWTRGGTDAEGYVQPGGPIDLEGGSLHVHLPNGRVWSSHAGPSPVVQGEGTVAVVVDPEVQVTVRGSVPEGCWIEARRWAWDGDQTDESGAASLLRLPWTRIEASGATVLDQGWTGLNLSVQARIQPAGLILGSWPVKNGIANIELPEFSLVHVWADLPAPTDGSGVWRLHIQSRGGQQSYQHSLLLSPQERADLVLPQGGYGLRLTTRGGAFNHLFIPREVLVNAPEQDLVLQLGASHAVQLEVYLNGQPVAGGHLLASGPDWWSGAELGGDGKGTILAPTDRTIWPIASRLVPASEVLDRLEDPILFGYLPAARLDPAMESLRLDFGLARLVLTLAEEQRSVQIESGTSYQGRTVFWPAHRLDCGPASRIHGDWRDAYFLTPPGQRTIAFHITEGLWKVVVQGRELTPPGGLLVTRDATVELAE